ncbi:MAG TPA: hypothetical protein VKV21_17970 [Solirubrobacteraceae bacterium]|nr:hypothetical protein [Solirubrobacteraceae bacterium]
MEQPAHGAPIEQPTPGAPMEQPAHGTPIEQPTPGAPIERPAPGARIALAALARDVALTVNGVAGLDDGPAGLFVTAGGGERIGGVRCVAAPEGGYEVSLRLVCELVPLLDLADRVRAAVTEAARAAELRLASVTITIADVVEEGGR